MARLYTSNNLKSKGVRGASEVEASKINEMNINQQVFQRKQEYKNSDENTHNNSHRWAKGRNFGEDATDIHPELSKEDNQDKEVTSGDENERKTNEAEHSHI
mmetsp:Transcript_20133/g.19772  ORF Transcript_20133/g.19772 Transcript_20133/m.19772 type:complete len:102 (-) Transcript_20133:1252-1557(-)